MRLRLCVLLVLISVFALFASAQVSYQTINLPAKLISIDNYTGTSGGTGWVLATTPGDGRYIPNLQTWLGKVSSGLVTQVSDEPFPIPTDLGITVADGRLVSGVFEARDEQPYVRVSGVGLAARNIRGVTRIKGFYDTSGPSGNLSWFCGDGFGVGVDGEDRLFAAYGAGPNIAADNRVLFSIYRWDGGPAQGIYQLPAGHSVRGGICQLKTVVETDPGYDLISVWGEAFGTYFVHRSSFNLNASKNVSERKKEVARLGQDGKVLTVLSRNSVECCDRVIASPTTRTIAWAEKWVDNKYHLFLTQMDGSSKEIVSSDSFLAPVSVLDQKFLLYAVGNSFAQLGTLKRYNLTKDIDSLVVADAKKFAQETGVTLGPGSISANKSWLDALGNVHFAVNGVNDRVFKVPTEMFADTAPPPSAPVISFAADKATITAGDSVVLTWSTSYAVSAALNGDSVALSGSTQVKPQQTTAYILTATGPGGTVTKSVTVAVIPASPVSLVEAVTDIFANTRTAAATNYAPGGLVIIWGKNLVPASTLPVVPFSFRFNYLNCSVRLTNAAGASWAGAMYYASPVQVNVQLPVVPVGAYTLTILNEGAVSASIPLNIVAIKLNVVTRIVAGKDYIAALHQDGSEVLPGNPARGGEILSFYLTGLGVTNPLVREGDAAPATAEATVQMEINGVPAEVLYAGLQGQFFGLYQVNVRVPEKIDIVTEAGISVSSPVADSVKMSVLH